MVSVEILCRLVVDSDGSVRLQHIPTLQTPAAKENDRFGFPAKPSAPDAIAVLRQLAPWVVSRFRKEVEDALARFPNGDPKEKKS